jgi:uncharacterized protein (TIGR02246 family)
MTDDERQIRRLVDSRIAASEAGDVPALLALMTDDVVFMTPGRPPFGKSEFAADAELNKDVAARARRDSGDRDHRFTRFDPQLDRGRPDRAGRLAPAHGGLAWRPPPR